MRLKKEDAFSKDDAQKVLNVLGTPDYSNLRGDLRVWKWVRVNKRLAHQLRTDHKLPLRSYDEGASVGIIVPASFSLRDFVRPKVTNTRTPAVCGPREIDPRVVLELQTTAAQLASRCVDARTLRYAIAVLRIY